MAPTTSFRDCQRFAQSVAAAGGRVPDTLGRLLQAHELLSSPAATQRPEDAILDAVLDGSLTAEKLAQLAPAAASAAATASYLKTLARDSEHVLLGEWHRQINAGSADEVLTSLRKRFDEHAKAIAHARTLIDPESNAEQILASGQPELVSAWQALSGHIQIVSKIGAVAAQFGPRLGAFPQVDEYSLAENARLSDSAIFCGCGPSVVADSAPFMRPDQGHRTSPWFRISLRLNSIAQARARYDEFAANEHDRVHSGARKGWIDQNGQTHWQPAPKNPYRKEVSV
jgi:hypothetical protein